MLSNWEIDLGMTKKAVEKSSVLQQSNIRILKRYDPDRILPLAIRRKEVLSIYFYLAILS